MKPEEPQSSRDLAHAKAAVGDYQAAIDLLGHVISQPWDTRFPRIGMIALHEMNAIIATCGQQLDLRFIDKRLLRHFPMDMRVTLDWDADLCDMDLWVNYYNQHPNRRGHGLMADALLAGLEGLDPPCLTPR